MWKERSFEFFSFAAAATVVDMCRIYKYIEGTMMLLQFPSGRQFFLLMLLMLFFFPSFHCASLFFLFLFLFPLAIEVAVVVLFFWTFSLDNSYCFPSFLLVVWFEICKSTIGTNVHMYLCCSMISSDSKLFWQDFDYFSLVWVSSLQFLGYFWVFYEMENYFECNFWVMDMPFQMQSVLII